MKKTYLISNESHWTAREGFYAVMEMNETDALRLALFFEKLNSFADEDSYMLHIEEISILKRVKIKEPDIIAMQEELRGYQEEVGDFDNALRAKDDYVIYNKVKSNEELLKIAKEIENGKTTESDD